MKYSQILINSIYLASNELISGIKDKLWKFKCMYLLTVQFVLWRQLALEVCVYSKLKVKVWENAQIYCVASIVHLWQIYI